MRNILTIDVEDWFHGLGAARALWPSLEKRLPVGLEFILSRLAARKIRATFFVLGEIARDYPDWVRRIAAEGHEVGTHGWSHSAVFRQSRDEFGRELRQSLDLLESLSGRPVLGHRAAMFSITARSLWALDELAVAGLDYDSSVFPVHNYRYGIPHAQRFPYRTGARELWELPLATARVAGVNVPAGGGFYARFWPYAWLRCTIQALNTQGQPAVIYFHPWEFDPAHPRLRAGATRLAHATHYFRLAGTQQTLDRLLDDFEWCGALDYLREEASC